MAALFFLLFAAEAQPPTQNFWWYSDDPFVIGDAQVLGTIALPDWTSRPTGSLSNPSVAVESLDATGALGASEVRTLAPAPILARFPLVNQYADDISVFALTGIGLRAAPGDAEGNGLADGWERRFFKRAGVDPAGDPDGDGFSTLAEFEAGTDPTRAASRPEIPGIVGTWTGDGHAEDASQGHHGLWIGSPSYVEGRLDKAFLVSSERSIRVPDAAEFRLDRALSIGAWIRLATISCNLQPVLARLSSLNGIPAYALSVNCSGIRLGLANAFASYLDGPSLTLSTGVWYHVAATWDGATTQIYLNGRIVFGRRRPTPFGPLDLPVGRDLRIGSDGATQFFDGALDQVVLANRVLSAEEVRWLAGGNSGRRGAISDSSLVVEREDQSLWRLESPEGPETFLTHGFDARLSGDRSRLFFRRAQTTPGDPASERLWMRDLVSGDEAPLFNLPQEGERVSFDVSSDGRAILVADAVRRRIERFGLDEGPVFAANAQVDTAAIGAPGELSVSREGGFLAWSSSSPGAGGDMLWVAGALGENARPMPVQPDGSSLLRMRRPSWAADGSKLVVLLGRNLIQVRPGSATIFPLTVFSGQAEEPVFSDVAPAWTVGADQVVTVASFPRRDTKRRLVFVAADGTGRLSERLLNGPAPVRVVFGGSGINPPPLQFAVRIESPVQEAQSPVLIFSAAGGVDPVVLESASGLSSVWQPQSAKIVATSNERRWSVILDERERLRFYRLRRLDP